MGSLGHEPTHDTDQLEQLAADVQELRGEIKDVMRAAYRMGRDDERREGESQRDWYARHARTRPRTGRHENRAGLRVIPGGLTAFATLLAWAAGAVSASAGYRRVALAATACVATAGVAAVGFQTVPVHERYDAVDPPTTRPATHVASRAEPSDRRSAARAHAADRGVRHAEADRHAAATSSRAHTDKPAPSATSAPSGAPRGLLPHGLKPPGGGSGSDDPPSDGGSSSPPGPSSSGSSSGSSRTPRHTGHDDNNCLIDVEPLPGLICSQA